MKIILCEKLIHKKFILYLRKKNLGEYNIVYISNKKYRIKFINKIDTFLKKTISQL